MSETNTATDRRVIQAVKWAYRYSALEADQFNTVDAAVKAAKWAADDGQESLDCIEVIHDDGTSQVLSPNEVDRLMEPLYAQEKAKVDARPKQTVWLIVKHPNGQWGRYSTFEDAETAEPRAEEWRDLIGPERVAVIPIDAPLLLD